MKETFNICVCSHGEHNHKDWSCTWSACDNCDCNGYEVDNLLCLEELANEQPA